jgi:hypothetical protein
MVSDMKFYKSEMMQMPSHCEPDNVGERARPFPSLGELLDFWFRETGALETPPWHGPMRPHHTAALKEQK